jgi:hypothetical protein
MSEPKRFQGVPRDELIRMLQRMDEVERQNQERANAIESLHTEMQEVERQNRELAIAIVRRDLDLRRARELREQAVRQCERVRENAEQLTRERDAEREYAEMCRACEVEKVGMYTRWLANARRSTIEELARKADGWSTESPDGHGYYLPSWLLEQLDTPTEQPTPEGTEP